MSTTRPACAKIVPMWWRPVFGSRTYRGWTWLILGGAILMPYMMVGQVVAVVVTGHGRTQTGDPLWAVQFPIFLAALPVIAASGLLLPVRPTAVLLARTLLATEIPEVTPSRTWARRGRDAAWFTIHLGVGGLLSGLTLALVPFAVFLVVVPFFPHPHTILATVGMSGWPLGWGPPLGPLILISLVYVIAAATALLRRAAPLLLGPTAAERLATERAERTRLAVRNRIARELHDSVGHALSVVTVQADAATRVLRDDPSFALRALEAISDTARHALDELDAVLGILREDGPASTEVAHTMDDLPDLLRTCGLNTETDIAPNLAPLPPVLSREAYRIVQESLTNALRHGADTTATIHIALDANTLAIHIANPIPATAHPPHPGRGITGMTERATVLGGDLTAAPHDGHWVVDARFPLGT
ncbi:MAG TPA: histidine kinase [Stackebrandtia sp.]|jgi:signal transduction histidine kinase|uniref:sensor histidine kinase n=1 Tax=Stackebrandtia sp. TaxID=2023065 RepID=UPI002D28C6D6|nr:histidine kinase [Stackebrandtia sp.]HZE39879.1 histidine kinase [Stackebrandtia sp.]